MVSVLKKHKILAIAAIILALIVAGIFFGHRRIYEIPEKRLSLTENYANMPEDSFHHYINLPLDYNQPSEGAFRGFYIYSPNFYKSKNITFLLTDGQMELVSPTTDIQFFENIIKGQAYVLIGVRGQSPSILPEVYKNAKVDYLTAERLLNSDQQIEDIERVRLALIQQGVLPNGSKINIFGASGAGVLAQQYVSKYGRYVNRVILESTGAPDLAKKMGQKYSPDFKDYNLPASRILDSVSFSNPVEKQRICNILYQTGRSERSPKDAQMKIVQGLRDGKSLLKYRFTPITNISLLTYLVQSPKEIAVRIRWFELAGYDLLQYNSRKETNLLYEFSLKAISDLIDYHRINKIPAKEFVINRDDFQGEVLILKGREDVVFSDTINIAMSKAYHNSRILFFNDGHRLQNDKEKYIQIRNSFLDSGFAAKNIMIPAS